MASNKAIFSKISTIDKHSLTITLDSHFESSLSTFRKLTSRIRRLNEIDYPVVYLSDNDYGGLTITYNSSQRIRLIVNLQFYYVYGFYLDDGKVYAFKGEAEKALTNFGFDCTIIPFGDGYYDIKKVLGEAAFNDLLSSEVTLKDIFNSLSSVADSSVNFSDKSQELLITLWSMAEGIRFAGISNVVSNLINQKHEHTVYSAFYNLAEVWSKLCVKAAKDKTLNQDIAVYDLDRIH